jgi:hypothetical protein
MRFKIGDMVKIKSFKWFERNKILFYDDTGDHCVILGNDFFSSEMVKFCGKFATIVKWSKESNKYYLDIDDGNHYWTEGMFDQMRKEKLEKLKNISGG